jgi:hypothetical protein
MNTPETGLTTPEAAMKELKIKNTQYYARLGKLGIKAKRVNGKAYLDEEQMAKLRSYSEPESAIATVDNDAEITLETVAPAEEEISEEKGRDIYREAAELKAQQLITPDLVKLYIASNIGENDLPPDLLQTVIAAREAANPKKLQSRIGAIAQDIIKQNQSQPQT